MVTGGDGECLLHRHTPFLFASKVPKCWECVWRGGDTPGPSHSASFSKDRPLLLLEVYSRASVGISSSPGRRGSSPIRVSSFPRPGGKGLLLHRQRRLRSPLLPPLPGCPRGWGFRTPRSPWARLGSRVREAAAPDSRQWLLWRQRLL